MLSITHTLNDTLTQLGGTFSDYGYEDLPAFELAVSSVLEDVEFLKIVPCIGRGLYDEIKAKDKVDLSEQENYLYKAEIYGACLEFTKKRKTRNSLSNNNASKEKLTIEGYTYEMSNTSGTSNTASLDVVQKEYSQKYKQYMKLIGCSINQLQRSGTVFG